MQERTADPEFEVILRRRAKAELRKRARGLRNAIPQGALALRSERLCVNLLSVSSLQGARRVALFYPMQQRNEVDLRSLHASLRTAGISVAYPVIASNSGEMTFRFANEFEALVESHFGFMQPNESCPVADALDVIIVPALEIDASGYRLGYGGGYYDRTLPSYAPPAVAIGVVFDFQLVPELPRTDGDIAVNVIVTDERILLPEPPDAPLGHR